MAALTQSAKENFALCVAMMVLTIIVLSMRLIMRFSLHQTLLGADWLCLLGAGFFYAYCAVVINFIFNVSGYHAFDADPSLGAVEFTNLSKWSYIDEIIFGCGISSIKLSILWFYHTIFAVNPKLRRVIQATALACVIWFLVATFVIIFQCNPIDAYWLKGDLPPYCLEGPRLLLGYELSNLFLDVIILCIPIAIIPQLHLRTTKKITIISIFLLGAFVCIASILRLTAIWNPPNVAQNFNFPFVLMWATLQLGLAIVCSCLPTLGPFIPTLTKPIPYLLSFYESIKSRVSESSATTRNRQMPSDMNSTERPWVKVGEDRANVSSNTWAYGNNSGGETSDHALQPIPSRTILVNHDVEVA